MSVFWMLTSMTYVKCLELLLMSWYLYRIYMPRIDHHGYTLIVYIFLYWIQQQILILLVIFCIFLSYLQMHISMNFHLDLLWLHIVLFMNSFNIYWIKITILTYFFINPINVYCNHLIIKQFVYLMLMILNLSIMICLMIIFFEIHN